MDSRGMLRQLSYPCEILRDFADDELSKLVLHELNFRHCVMTVSQFLYRLLQDRTQSDMHYHVAM